MTHHRARPSDPEVLADLIGRATPFSARPRDALLRLAAASSVSSHRSGTTLIVAVQPCDAITVIAEGATISSVTHPGGRRVVFKFDDLAYAFGLFSQVDGLTQGHDLVADGPVSVIRIPHATIRCELARLPSLWESIAAEITRRARGMNRQMQQFVFDAPLVRAASLLLSLLAKNREHGEPGPVAIELRLPQERLAELLGTSRQWAAAVARELSNAGLVEWRYGRVTVLDVQALRALAARGIDAMGQHSEQLAPRQRVARHHPPAARAVAPQADATGGGKRRTK